MTLHLGIRPQDRRDAAIAFLTLFGVMTAHSLLETARDALFLSTLPARELPWAYIAMALSSLAVSELVRRLRGRVPRRAVLTFTLVAGGAITAAFQWLVRTPSNAALFALYAWAGVLATSVVVEFWLLAAEVLDFGQAKRVFAVAGAGGLAGAVAGSGAAGLLLESTSPAGLLPVSGAVLAATGLAPLLFSPAATPVAAPRRRVPSTFRMDLRKEPYLRRILLVTAVSSVAITCIDFVFKATASVDLAPEQLGPFFARFYAATSGIALLLQLFVAPRLLHVLGVSGSLLLLPTLLVAGAAGFLVTGGLGSILLVRGADGALRHSIQRTGTEILFVPLSPQVRERYKGLVEAIGQRGGQGLASLALIAAGAAGLSHVHLRLGLLALAAGWLVATLGLRPHYVELFRRNLREGALETHAEVPDLDLSSLEALIASLSSNDDHEVLAALDLLAAYGKTNLVPALVLYHPSPEVVLRAFALLDGEDRPDVVRLVARLVSHDDERVRAAALRHSVAHAAPELLASMSEDPSPAVRATVLVERIRRGEVGTADADRHLRAFVQDGSPELHRSLAYAARHLPRGAHTWLLPRLTELGEPGLSAEVARAMAAAPSPAHLPALIRLLALRECRNDARAAIVALGPAALDALAAALEDPTLPLAVRRQLPRTLARFGGPRAAALLTRRLPLEPDEAVELQLARALARLVRSDPTLAMDTRLLLDEARVALERAVTLLFHRVIVDRLSLSQEDHRSSVAELLAALLGDKERAALERAFRLLQALDPAEDFDVLLTGLRSQDAGRRASARELVSHVVPEPLRGGILAVLDDGDAAERLQVAFRFHSPRGRTRYERAIAGLGDAPDAARAAAVEELRGLHVECLRDMLLDPSDVLRSVASHRLSELGLAAGEPARAAGSAATRGEAESRAAATTGRPAVEEVSGAS